MAVAPRANPLDHFTAAQWQALTTRSRWRGLWLVAHCWASIALAMAAVARWPWLWPLGVMLVGTRQLGLFILMHDGAHALLHPSRRVNDWVATWLCGPGLAAYRPYHLKHHRYVQQQEDPDLVLSAPFPITRRSLWRKLARDLSGQTFFKQQFGSVRQRLQQRPAGQPAWRAIGPALATQRRWFIAHGLGLAAFTLAGHPLLWVAMWLLPQACWLPLVSRLRNIAEHALVAQNGDDPLKQARTTHAGWAERALIAPYWVNYHSEHHLFTSLPCWQLPKAHALLAAQGTTARMELQPGYIAVLRLAASAAPQPA
jgi:fatty acid desaturase